MQRTLTSNDFNKIQSESLHVQSKFMVQNCNHSKMNFTILPIIVVHGSITFKVLFIFYNVSAIIICPESR
jgi:hypothetical protein